MVSLGSLFEMCCNGSRGDAGGEAVWNCRRRVGGGMVDWNELKVEIVIFPYRKSLP